jgi:hypothetical protein
VLIVPALEPAHGRIFVAESGVGEGDVERRQIAISAGANQALDEAFPIGTMARDAVRVGEVGGVAGLGNSGPSDIAGTPRKPQSVAR